MQVKKGSWHHKLVQNKSFVSNPKGDNTDAMSYITEAWLAIYVDYLLLPLMLIMFFSYTLGSLEAIKMEYSEFVIAFLAIMSSPLGRRWPEAG